MPIDISVARSPGWWLNREYNRLSERRRRTRLQKLHNYLHGHAPLPEGAENARDAWQAFQKKARSNFGQLITGAVSHRMRLGGFRTAVDADVSGDAEVGRMWKNAGMAVTCNNVHDLALGLGESYVIVGGINPVTKAPRITAEDPRMMIGEPDPADDRFLLCALKMMHDDAAGEDRAYLFLPGQVWVASRKQSRLDVSAHLMAYDSCDPKNMPSLPAFDPRSWEWDLNRSGSLPHDQIPVVWFQNKSGEGEFEAHTDLLDRINHEIFQRMVISTMQAFRQRAAINLPMVYPEGHPKAGDEIDYHLLFQADPGAFWQLPEGSEMWESAATDLRPLLSAVKDDLEHLGSVTSTPLHMLTSGGENQSAEGASLAREGLVFKTEDRIDRFTFPWARVASLALLHLGQPDRADLSKLEPIWGAAERLSLQERADAASKVSPFMPRRTLFISVMGMTPQDADRAMTELADEQVLALQIQFQQAQLLSLQRGTETAPAAIEASPASPVSQPAIAAGPAQVPQPALT